MLTLKDRFLSKIEVDPVTGCWNWIAGKFPSGYGQIYVNGTSEGAHRVAWRLFRGEIPTGKMVLHTCIGNRACASPNHLYLGTNTDNYQDIVEQGRSNRGTKSGTAKLNDENVRYIRTSNKSGCQLADELGVSTQAIWRIRHRLTWNHVS